MTHVATLIGPSLEAALARAQTLLGGTAERLGAHAADISFTPKAHAGAIAEKLRGEFNIDVVVQPAAHRRKKLFLADMDSTMIQQECIDELADYAGLKAHIATITERAMRGEIAFEEVLRERIKLTDGARTLIATMRKNGARTCMVSGGFTHFTDRVAAMIGFDETRANRLTIVDGRKLAGTVAEPIFGRDGKRAALIELRHELKLARAETMAIGDGANDMDMIAEAGLGVAYHAKPKVAAAAPARIDYADLTALLYVQGYRKDEFVDG